jgi:NNP family nitrate/nitrite transporter-like MFS transporter
MTTPTSASSERQALALATVSFVLCFAAWGLIGASAPLVRDRYGLSGAATALLVATPVLLGALARVPLGMLTDRLGGRVVFPALMIVSAGAAWCVPFATGLASLLAMAFWLGLAGASFAVGAAFVSRWAPAAHQGTALGIYGLGNIGQSLAVFGGPVAAAWIGWPAIFRGVGIVLLVWGAIFWLIARDAPVTAPRRTVGDMLRLLTATRIPALLSLCYFLTFGGCVAFSM